LGTATWDENTSEDFFVLDRQVNCLALLKALCQALQVTVDVFSKSYAIKPLVMATAPADGAVLVLEDSNIERWRRYRYACTHLVETERGDYVYGLYDDDNWPTPYYYTWGVPDPDVETEIRAAEYEDSGVDAASQLSLTQPAHFRIYWIGVDTSNYFRSRVVGIANGETGDTEMDQWLDQYISVMHGYTRRARYQAKMAALAMAYPRMSVDVKRKTREYEVWT
jgi:hypothetical protein